MPGWLAVLSTLAGASIGALLRPLLDNYFELRRKTLRVDLSAGRSEFILPDKHMKIVWGDRIFTRLFQWPFTIESPSSWDQNNFLLKIELLDPAGIPVGVEQLFEVVMRRNQSADFTNVSNTPHMRPTNAFEFTRFDAKGRVHGFAVAECDGTLKFWSKDLQIVTVWGRRALFGSEGVQWLLALFTAALAAATLIILWPEPFGDMLRKFAQILGI